MRAWKHLATWATLGTVLVAGCTGTDPVTASAGANDGGVQAEAGARCDPASATRCEGDAIVACPAGNVTTTACPLGCDAATATCKRTRTTTAAAAASTAAATFATPITDVVDERIETDTGFIGRRRDNDGTVFDVIRAAGADGDASGITYEVVDQIGAPRLAVFGFARLDIRAGAALRVTGPHAVAFVSATDIVIDGQLSLRGDCAARTPGPGGSMQNLMTPATDGAPGSGVASTPSTVDTAMSQACGGAGGGGNGTDGDRGGNATNSMNGTRMSSGGSAGAKRVKSIFDVPTLAGGGGGGGGLGGPGGRAAGFVANGDVHVGGVVEAGGCGGKYANINGASPNTCGAGGGGGGAGGAILFEASRLVVSASGRILAHGGGGGGGGDGSPNSGRPTDGADASAVDATPAAGGMAGGDNITFHCRPGGTGSPFAMLSGPCENNVGNSVRGGGGGGGAGIIAARTTANGVIVDPAAIVSPPLAQDTVQTR